MGRMTNWNKGKCLLVNEEERLLTEKGFIDKDEMYKIMRHLAEKLADYEKLEARLQAVYGECDGLLEKVVEHLEQHESIGLPEPVFKSRLLTDREVDKWEEYKTLEEQGLLLKLPCKVGDTVYHICTFGSGESEIIEMKVYCVDPCGAIRNHKGIYETWNVYAETEFTKEYFKFSDFGKTVFLTLAEAEDALRKMKGMEG